MQFFFEFPIRHIRTGMIICQAEMMAELIGSPEDPLIEALYLYEDGTTKRVELQPSELEFKMAAEYLGSSPQERELIADKWPEDVSPRRRSVGNEHSTYVGRP